MKYILVLCDGMADYPIAELEGKTPLEFATTKNMDALAPYSTIGLVKTVPDGFEPGSDVANLGVLGYDANICYTGRSPIEALSIGVNLKQGELALRANLVTLSDDEPFENKRLVDYSGGEISTAEAAELIDALKPLLSGLNMQLYVGTSYRHCLVVKNAEVGNTLTPPHNITDCQIGEYLPKGALEKELIRLTKQSYELLSKHPINLKRIEEGKRPANAIWLWGEGTCLSLESFESKYHKKGAMISAVDLLKGIAIASGMQVVNVPGATGTVDTDYCAKARYAIDALESGCDFCMIHLEGTDECGHQRDLDGKVRGITSIDEKIIGELLAHFASTGEAFRLLVMPDHPTPVALGKHTSEPVPFMLFDSNKLSAIYAACKPIDIAELARFNEKTALKAGVYFQKPWELLEQFLA